jgi:hypothetical protein
MGRNKKGENKNEEIDNVFENWFYWFELGDTIGCFTSSTNKSGSYGARLFVDSLC